MNTAEAQRLLAQRRIEEAATLRVDPRAHMIGRECNRMLDRLMRDLEHSGYVARHEVRCAFDDARGQMVTYLIIELRDGRPLRYEFTDDEIRMGGARGFGAFLDQIDVSIRGDYRGRRPLLYEQEGRLLDRALDGSYAMPPPRQSDHHLLLDMIHRDMRAWIDAPGAERDKKANERAKALFISVAGKPCFDALESGKSWQLKAASGEVYELTKKASFCIRRQKDGAQMCAVVPGVPLWDHLLGIKLMIEHDEERFLATANVAGSITPGGLTWVQEEMLGAAYRTMGDRIVNPPMFIGLDPASLV